MTQHTVPATWHADFFIEIPNEFWRRAVRRGPGGGPFRLGAGRLVVTARR